MDLDLTSTPKRPVCVLSVGRSGTSLAARAINLLGVHLGAEQDMMTDEILMSPRVRNERGYWENLAIYRLNEDLLERLGGSWYMPPDLEPGWDGDARLDDLSGRATGLIEELAGNGQRWGFKDPRTIILLPFWRRVIGEMDYVICIRRPLAVISSVQEIGAPGIEPDATARLWLDMNAAALEQTVDERRMFIFYEDWFENPHSLARRLAVFIHGDGATPDSQSLDAVESFFDPSLRHADASLEPAELTGMLELEAMYTYLRHVAERDSDDPQVRSREALIAGALAESYRQRQELAGASPRDSRKDGQPNTCSSTPLS